MYSVIVPAAGSGERLGFAVPKALVPMTIKGSSKTILEWTLRIFNRDPECVAVVVAVPAGSHDDVVRLLTPFSKISVVVGGSTRQESVRIGLHFLARSLGVRESSTVLVHDAARCAVSPDLVARVAAGVAARGAVTAAVPVVDALLSASESREVQGEVSRAGLWSVQTPQGFLVGDLTKAHEFALANGIAALDDASLVRTHRAVFVVDGERSNIKVTYRDDLAQAASWIEQQESEEEFEYE